VLPLLDLHVPLLVPFNSRTVLPSAYSL